MVSPAENDIPYGLILHPTKEEFANFAAYWEKLEKEKKLSGYGIVKVDFSRMMALRHLFPGRSPRQVEAKSTTYQTRIK